MNRRIMKRAAALALTAVSAFGLTAVSQPQAAEAAIWWDPPPKCIEHLWHQTGSGQVGFYTKAFEYTRRFSYGGGVETRYIWVWEVQTPFYPYGMLTVGRAEKHCGSTWAPGGA